MRIKHRTAAVLAGAALVGAAGVGVAAAAANGSGNPLSNALAGLVSKGTISQEQADAVEKALTDARDQARADHDQRHTEERAAVDALLKDTLGMTGDELREQLRAGKTLKEIAGDKAKALADGLVALAEKRAAAAVETGRISQEQADQMVTRARERADAWLAGTNDELGRGSGLGPLLGRGGMMEDGPRGGRGHGGMGWGRGDGGPGEGGPGEGSSSTSPSQSTDPSPTT